MSENSEIYELIDSGYGRKLERFGAYLLDRPCAQAVWQPLLSQKDWSKADAFFTREGDINWSFRKQVPETWQCRIEGIDFLLSLTNFGHTGVFPEHSLAWRKLGKFCNERTEQLNVLNLFAYTGGATLALAKAGCKVCHLDASAKTVEWARKNAAINNLENAEIRWIVDDVQKFLRREIRRKRFYDGIILDPPSFGRGKRQELFQIDNHLRDLLQLCKQLLSKNASFVFLSSHTAGYTPTVLTNLLQQNLLEGSFEAGELFLPKTKTALELPNGAYSFWRG